MQYVTQAAAVMEQMVRGHEVTAPTLVSVLVLVVAVAYLVGLGVGAAYEVAAAAVRRRRVQRVAREGGRGYVDPARMHVETGRELARLARRPVERCASRVAAVAGAAPPRAEGSEPGPVGRADGRHVARAARVPGDAAGASGSRAADLAAGVARVSPASRDGRLGRDSGSGYGLGTALVFPSHMRPEKRLN